MKCFLHGIAIIVGMVFLASPVLAQTAASKGTTLATARAEAPEAKRLGKSRQLSTEIKLWTGDFDQMLKRRGIRVLVPYSRSLYYNDKGRDRGIMAELVRDFERYVNQKYAKQLGKRPVTVFIVPATRDRLLPDLPEGRGDISAGNLTVTDERLKMVDFYVPQDLRPVSEVVVTGPKSPSVDTLDDLAGKTVHVRMASSYYESLVALNERFAKEGKQPIKLVLVPDALEDEDLMDMLGAGLLEVIVVDNWKAKAWSQVVPTIKVHEDVVVRTGGRTGWAFRKNSPKLAAELDDFYRSWVKKQNVIAYRQAQY